MSLNRQEKKVSDKWRITGILCACRRKKNKIPQKQQKTEENLHYGAIRVQISHVYCKRCERERSTI